MIDNFGENAVSLTETSTSVEPKPAAGKEVVPDATPTKARRKRKSAFDTEDPDYRRAAQARDAQMGEIGMKQERNRAAFRKATGEVVERMLEELDAQERAAIFEMLQPHASTSQLRVLSESRYFR